MTISSPCLLIYGGFFEFRAYTVIHAWSLSQSLDFFSNFLILQLTIFPLVTYPILSLKKPPSFPVIVYAGLIQWLYS